MISIIVPTYGRRDQLQEALKSILSQTYQHFEIIVVDGLGSMQTKKLSKSFKDSRITYLSNKHHTGPMSSRYLGVCKSKYELIAFLDDDDLWSKNKLELQYSAFSNNHNTDLVLCDYIINDLSTGQQKKISLEKFKQNFNNILLSPGPFFQCILIKKNRILNKELYDCRATPSEDWDFFIELSKKPIVVLNIGKPLFIWNFSAQSLSANMPKEAAAVDYIIQKHSKYIIQKTSLKNLSRLHRKSGHLYIQSKNYGVAKKKYFKAFLCYAFSFKNLLFFIISFLCGGFLIKTYLNKNEK